MLRFEEFNDTQDPSKKNWRPWIGKLEPWRKSALNKSPPLNRELVIRPARSRPSPGSVPSPETVIPSSATPAQSWHHKSHLDSGTWAPPIRWCLPVHSVESMLNRYTCCNNLPSLNTHIYRHILVWHSLELTPFSMPIGLHRSILEVAAHQKW